MPGNFDKIAPFYGRLSRMVFGNLLINSQLHFASNIPPQASVLIWGGGDGSILNEFWEITRPKKVVFLENSKKMISLAQEKLDKLDPAFTKRTELRHGTEEDLKSHESFDIIMCPFILDLFSTEALIEKLALLKKYMKGDALILFTDFHLSKHPSRFFHKPLISLMYTFFRWVANIHVKKLPDFNHAFNQTGFICLEERFWANGLIQSKVYGKK